MITRKKKNWIFFFWNFAIHSWCLWSFRSGKWDYFSAIFCEICSVWNLIWLNYEILEGDLIGDSHGVCDAESINDFLKNNGIWIWGWDSDLGGKNYGVSCFDYLIGWNQWFGVSLESYLWLPFRFSYCWV